VQETSSGRVAVVGHLDVAVVVANVHRRSTWGAQQLAVKVVITSLQNGLCIKRLVQVVIVIAVLGNRFGQLIIQREGNSRGGSSLCTNLVRFVTRLVVRIVFRVRGGGVASLSRQQLVEGYPWVTLLRRVQLYSGQADSLVEGRTWGCKVARALCRGGERQRAQGHCM